MLDEGEKTRIREEELFRHEVQQQLNAERPPASIGKRLWDLANKPFVLWSLSSLVLGLIGWMYTNYQAYILEQAQHRQLKQKILNEIISRAMESLLFLSDERAKEGQRGSDFPRVIYLRILDTFNNKDQSNTNSIYPEYRDRSYLSLITELSSVVSYEDKKYIANAQDLYYEVKILAFMNRPNYQVDNAKFTNEEFEKANNILNAIMRNIGLSAGAKLPPVLDMK
jgi:hypothetical protein